MDIRTRFDTYSGWGCMGYKTKAEAENIKRKVEANIRSMPGLVKLDVSVAINSDTGRFVVFDHSSYDEDERKKLTRLPYQARLNLT